MAADSLETGPVEYELRMLFQRLKLLEDVDARAVPTAKSVYPTLGKLRVKCGKPDDLILCMINLFCSISIFLIFWTTVSLVDGSST